MAGNIVRTYQGIGGVGKHKGQEASSILPLLAAAVAGPIKGKVETKVNVEREVAPPPPPPARLPLHAEAVGERI